MDPGITDDNFDDWLDLDGEENFPLQAEAAAFPEPGPSASQARKMDNKSHSNDVGLCRMCLGSFKRGTHKKKDCKKHHRYSNLLARSTQGSSGESYHEIMSSPHLPRDIQDFKTNNQNNK